MNDDRHNERDSQLSAMFDGELPAAECELLARRLVRDEVLRAQWSRFSMVGAALRAERGVALHDRVANRVQAAVTQEATYGSGADSATTRTATTVQGEVLRRAASRNWSRLARPMFGAGIAASVAAASILFLRGADNQPEEILAAVPSPLAVVAAGNNSPAVTKVAPASTMLAQVPSSGEPDRYTTPAPSSQTNLAPPARLANYVVAHSEYSGPLSRRMALLGLVGTDTLIDPEPLDGTEPQSVAGAPDAQ